MPKLFICREWSGNAGKNHSFLNCSIIWRICIADVLCGWTQLSSEGRLLLLCVVVGVLVFYFCCTILFFFGDGILWMYVGDHGFRAVVTHIRLKTHRKPPSTHDTKSPRPSDVCFAEVPAPEKRGRVTPGPHLQLSGGSGQATGHSRHKPALQEEEPQSQEHLQQSRQQKVW